MNKKYFFSLLVIALFVAACTPVVTGNEMPKVSAQPAVQDDAALIPVSGASDSITNRTVEEPRLWSGEIFNSDSNNPDHRERIQSPGNITTDSACSSADDLERRYGGCIE